MSLRVLAKKNVQLIIVLLAVSGSLAASERLASSPFGMANPALHISTIGDRTTIALTEPELLRSQTLVDGRYQAEFALVGESNVQEAGFPALPHVTRLYRIPDQGGVEYHILSADYSVEQNVWLAMESTQDEWFPAAPVMMSEPMIFRDFRVVQLTLYPLQYNRETQELRTYSNLEVEIVPNAEPGVNEITHSRVPSGAFVPLYRDLIPNLDPVILDNASRTPGSYLIVCKNSGVMPQFVDSLARWKRLRGYAVRVDMRNNWSVATMRTAIQNAYENSDPPLEYVLLMGDPSAQIGVPTDGQNFDHTFALGNAGDDLEDIAAGRFSANSASELATMTAKLFYYERTPELTDSLWTRRAFLYAATSMEGPRNHNVVRWQRDQFAHFTAVDSLTVATHNGSVDAPFVRSQINRGMGFFLWTGTWLGQMQTDLAGSCAVNHRLPVVMTITEGTGNFDSGLSIAESWHVAGTLPNPKGGVCAIGMANSAGHPQNVNTLSGGFVYSVCNLGVENVGIAVMGMKYQLGHVFGFGSVFQNHARWVNLMGDPSLSMWTDRLQVTTVNFPEQIAARTNSIRMEVRSADDLSAVADARVVLLSDTTVIANAQTDESGFVDLPFAGIAVDSLQFAVTKPNTVPYLGVIRVAPADVDVSAASNLIDDDNTGGTHGNGDHYLNPGELVDMPVYFRNFGSTTATDISAQVTCSNPHITLWATELFCRDLEPGDSAVTISPLRIEISPHTRIDECVPLSLEIFSGAVISRTVFQPLIHAPSLEFEGYAVTGGDDDELAEPGETVTLNVTLRNLGNEMALASFAELSAASPAVSVVSGVTNFDFISPGQSRTNSGAPLTLRVHEGAYRGGLAHFQLLLQRTQTIDTVLFSIPLGVASASDPTGPDAYGYFAYEDSDIESGFARPYEWIEISGVGTELNLNDPGEENAATPVMSVVRPLPFSFIFYGQEYSQITICSNGWAAFGDHTGLDQHMNYPIPGQQAPDALLAPYWDDLATIANGDGVWDYYDDAHDRYVIQWIAQIPDFDVEEVFEIVLLDPRVAAAADGSGIVVFQYHDVEEHAGQQSTDIPYATIGIQAPGCLTGLQYRFNSIGAPGTSNFENGRSIVFTTDARTFTGGIRGHVVNAYTHQVIPGARVVLGADSLLTDADGMFLFQQLTFGSHTLQLSANDYEPLVVENVPVFVDSVTSITIELTPITPQDVDPRVPLRFELGQNFPNPFNNSTLIEFAVPRTERVQLVLYNLVGQVANTIVDREYAAGRYRVALDGTGLAAGVYLYRLTSASGQMTRKLVLLK